MLLTVAAVIIVLWLLGLIGHVGGGLIHLLLVVGLIMLAYNFLVSHRA